MKEKIGFYKKTALTVILLFFLSLDLLKVLHAQTLVPNGSFEEKNRIGDESSITLIKNWTGANENMGDYYFKGNSDKESDVPENIFGDQEPHSGDAYTGICVEKNFAEYIQTTLSAPLVKNQQYTIRLYICKAEKKKTVLNELGVMFLPKMKETFPKEGIIAKPQVIFKNEDGFTDEDSWTELSAVYKATGKETAIIIGYFPYEQRIAGKAHYYIDDVSITPKEK